ncbi:MAG: PilW family protein [Gammaproteobacteria bacterium]|nr:PilW family protein [Gammaproteobacteria bacterium]
MNSDLIKMRRRQTGITLVELMVALAIGSFLMIGTVQIYNQSRQAFVVNESIARVQETAQFAMDTIEADLRMASNWGRNSRGLAVEGRAIAGDANPISLATVPVLCGDDWATNLGIPIDGSDNGYTLACGGVDGEDPNSDVVTVRRASVNPVVPLAGKLQIQTTRIQGQIFENGLIPNSFSPADSTTHDLMVTSYYVAPTSGLIAGVPTLRRQRLTAGPAIVDEEVAPGVENLQLQFGIDIDQDNTVDRYVNPGDPIYDPQAAGYVPGARVITARVWMLVRGIIAEPGVQDSTNYSPGNQPLGVINDNFRRMLVSKTILLRNART